MVQIWQNNWWQWLNCKNPWKNYWLHWFLLKDHRPFHRLKKMTIAMVYFTSIKNSMKGQPYEADRPSPSVEPCVLQGLNFFENIAIISPPRAPVNPSSGLELEWIFWRSWRRPTWMTWTCLGTACRSTLTALTWTLCLGLKICPTKTPDIHSPSFFSSRLLKPIDF